MNWNIYLWNKINMMYSVWRLPFLKIYWTQSHFRRDCTLIMLVVRDLKINYIEMFFWSDRNQGNVTFYSKIPEIPEYHQIVTWFLRNKRARHLPIDSPEQVDRFWYLGCRTTPRNGSCILLCRRLDGLSRCPNPGFGALAGPATRDEGGKPDCPPTHENYGMSGRCLQKPFSALRNSYAVKF